MIDNFAEVTRLYRQGHDGAVPELLADERIGDISDLRAAAVLVAITDRAEPGVLLLHRPSDMRAHPGQVALPGGKIDPGENPTEAALREAREELGIPEEAVRVIGETDLYRTHSGFAITPVLGIVPPDLEIVPNPLEVSKWFEAPLAFVLDPANQQQVWTEWQGARRAYYEINWREHRIWGVTAALIVNLSRRLRWPV